MEFELTIVQKLRVKSWKAFHSLTCCGSSFSYVFTPNGIGTGIVVRCNRCGADKDVTECERF